MDIKDYLTKFYNFLKNKAVLLLILLLVVCIFLDVLIYYKYVFLLENKEIKVNFQAEEVPQEKLNSVLEEVEKRKENIQKANELKDLRDIFY